MFADATHQLDTALDDRGKQGKSVGSDTSLEIDMDALLPPFSPNKNDTIIPKLEVVDVNKDKEHDEMEPEDVNDDDDSDDEEH